MEDLISQYIDRASFEADTKFAQEQLASLEASYKQLRDSRVNLSKATGTGNIISAAKESSTVLEQLKIKNQELTASIKEQQLAIKAAAEERRVQAAAEKAAAAQTKADIAQRIAAEKEAAKQAQIAGQEKLRAIQQQAAAEEELAAAQKENPQSLGTYDIAQGSGQQGGAKLVGNAVSQPAFIPANKTESSLLYLTKTETSLKNNLTAQKALDLELKNGTITQAEYDQQIVAAKLAESEYRKQIQLTNAELKARTNADFAIQGSIDAAKAQNAILIQQRNSTPVGEGASPEDIERVKELNAEIDKNNELIDKNNDLLGRQKINIGNYPNAFGGAFKTLNTELEAVQGKLVSGNFQGKEFDQLTAKLNVLQNATALTGKTFATTGAQSKAFSEAAIQIGQVYGKDSEVFKSFAAGVKEGNVNIKGLASEVSGVVSKGKGFLGFLSSAFNGLRKLAYAIPGIGIGGLILLMIGPLQAAGAALVEMLVPISKLKIAFETLGNVNIKSIEIFNKQTTSLQESLAVLNDSSISLNDRHNELDKLIAQSPDYLRGLTLENLNTDEGRKILDAYNKSLKTKGELQAAQSVNEDANKQLATLNVQKEAILALMKTGASTPLEPILEDINHKIEAATIAQSISLKIYKGKFKENLTSGKNSVKGIIEDLQEKINTLQKIQPTLLTPEAITKNVAEIKKLQDEIDKLLGKVPKGARQRHQDSENLSDEFRKKALKAQQEYLKAVSEAELNGYKTVADDQLVSFDERLAAEKNYYKKSVAITNQAVQDQIDAVNLEANLAEKRAGKIKDPKKRAETESAIEEYRVNAIKKIHETGNAELLKDDENYYDATVKISNQAFEKIRKASEEATKFIVEQQKIARQNQKDEIDISKNDKLLQLDRDYQAGSIKNIETYNQKKQSIEDEANAEQLKNEIENLKELEAFTEFYGFKNLDYLKKISDDEVALEDLKNQKLLKKERELIDAKNELGRQALTTLAAFVDAGFEKQKNANDQAQKDLDARTQREIDLENLTVDSAQQKASKIAVINERAAAQKDLLAKKQAAQDVKKAEFDKAVSIAQIIQNTAIAITSHLKEPWLIPFDIAMGALELGVVIAQPIPKYKHGKKDKYEGPAIVGDGGVPEYIKREDGTIQKTPAHDTLTYVGRNDVIFPDHMAMMRALAMPKIKGVPVTGISNNALYAEIKKQTPLLSQIANKKELHLGASRHGMEAIWKWGAQQTEYVNQNTNW